MDDVIYLYFCTWKKTYKTYDTNGTYIFLDILKYRLDKPQYCPCIKLRYTWTNAKIYDKRNAIRL